MILVGNSSLGEELARGYSLSKFLQNIIVVVIVITTIIIIMILIIGHSTSPSDPISINPPINLGSSTLDTCLRLRLQALVHIEIYGRT